MFAIVRQRLFSPKQTPKKDLLSKREMDSSLRRGRFAIKFNSPLLSPMHCTTERMSVGLFLVEKNVIQDNPSYQRESGIWDQEKQQLFIDSLFNGYDVPKIYLHDLRGKDPRFKFAVIDGKQRLHTIWSFLDGSLPLAADFQLSALEGRPALAGGSKFLEVDPVWQEVFKGKLLDVVLVQNASEDDIEDLFSRLNNGEPLNAAEKRNAKGGDMAKLIREAADLSFFKDKLGFDEKRYRHLEVAAKFLLIEDKERNGGEAFCDLKKRFLDKLVTDNKKMSKVDHDGLLSRVETQLKSLNRVFTKRDPMLNKQAYPPLYYLFVKTIERDYADAKLYERITKTLENFNTLRIANLEQPEDKRDSLLTEFGRLMQQGTNDLNSLRSRVSILRRHFLQENPDVSLRDKKRDFTEEERLAIWLLGGRQCALCKNPIKELEDMHADHHRQWAHGGPTTLKNGRCLCKECNQSEAKKVR